MKRLRTALMLSLAALTSLPTAAGERASDGSANEQIPAERKRKKAETTPTVRHDAEIFFVGNSVTFGATLADRNKQSPVAVATAELSKQMSGKSFRSHNMGRCGATTTDWLPTDKGLYASMADSARSVMKGADGTTLIFAICLGTNDSAADKVNGAALSTEAYCKNMREIIDSLMSQFPKAEIVVNSPTWYSANTYNSARYLAEGQARLAGYRKALPTLVQRYRNKHKRNVTLGAEEAWDAMEGRAELFTPEQGKAGVFHLHPNAAGAAKLGKIWAKAIGKAFRHATLNTVKLPSGAEMYVYPSVTGKADKSVIICPGGGYVFLADEHEGKEIAHWMSERGITAYVVMYRFPKGDWTVPNTDVREAFEYARTHADELGGYTKVGVMGSSAGGHLASTVATHTSLPDFHILLYPVISMDPERTHRGSHDNLLGADASAEMNDKFSNEKQVTAKTSPAFIALSLDDTVVPALTNGLPYVEALTRNGVRATLISYPTGGHGWGWNENFTYNAEWKAELAKFLGVKP